MRKLTRQDKGRDNNRGIYMATDPINIAGVRWDNNFQQPTGIYSTGVNTAMDPQNLNNSRIPAESSKVPFTPRTIDTTPSTDTTKGRVIDTYA